MLEPLQPTPLKDKLLRQILQNLGRYRLDRATISRLEYKKISELLQKLYLSLPYSNEIEDLRENVDLASLQELTTLISKIRQRSRSNYSIDECLREHLQEVRQYRMTTPEYQEALERLLNLIEFLPGILYSDHPNYPKAIEKTLEDIKKKFKYWWEKPGRYIDDTRSDKLRKHFVNWVNIILSCDIKDECERKLKPPSSLDCYNNKEAGKTTFLEEQPDPRLFYNPLLGYY